MGLYDPYAIQIIGGIIATVIGGTILYFIQFRKDKNNSISEIKLPKIELDSGCILPLFLISITIATNIVFIASYGLGNQEILIALVVTDIMMFILVLLTISK
jgi:hypothetical protein